MLDLEQIRRGWEWAVALNAWWFCVGCGTFGFGIFGSGEGQYRIFPSYSRFYTYDPPSVLPLPISYGRAHPVRSLCRQCASGHQLSFFRCSGCANVLILPSHWVVPQGGRWFCPECDHRTPRPHPSVAPRGGDAT